MDFPPTHTLILVHIGEFNNEYSGYRETIEE